MNISKFWRANGHPASEEPKCEEGDPLLVIEICDITGQIIPVCAVYDKRTGKFKDQYSGDECTDVHMWAYFPNFQEEEGDED